IASLNANYRPTDRWNLNAGYSNFRNDTKLRGRTDLTNPIDSIFLAQVTQSVNGLILRRLGKESRPASLSLTAHYQRASNVVNDQVQLDNQSQFTNLALSYAAGNPARGWQWNVGITGNVVTLGPFTNRSVSPTLGLHKRLFNNALTAQLRSALSLVSSPDRPERDHSVLNLSGGLAYRLKNAHSLRLSAVYLDRFGAEAADRNFREWYGSVNYGYRFGGSIGGKSRPAGTDYKK
ncbi:MAG: hypothetical protein AAFZ52_07595, partial [Bacteroidota bacterium]